jgi:hypothetical protein
MLFYLLFLNLLLPSLSYNLCVVGGSSGLGKELIYQGTKERQLNVLSLTSSINSITVPCRENNFIKIKNAKTFKHPYLTIDNYWKDISRHSYTNLIFSTCSKPFENDYSDSLMKKILEFLPNNCQSIHLISLCKKNKINQWYLKDSYRAKKEQEKILKKYQCKLNIHIYRPNCLIYEKEKKISKSITRQKLANEILDNCV